MIVPQPAFPVGSGQVKLAPHWPGVFGSGDGGDGHKIEEQSMKETAKLSGIELAVLQATVKPVVAAGF